MKEPVIHTEEIWKTYHLGDEVHALRGVSVDVYPGEFIAIMGASGSGKSTLMNLIGCLDRPSKGRYFLDDVDTSTLSRDQYADIRNAKIGFVFQGFNLIPRTSAIENVLLPLLYDRHEKIQNERKKAVDMLELVGLGDRMGHEPNQMSGGQQQRVAIARALVNDPSIVLADEPTGNLDSRTSIEIMALFQKLHEEGRTIIMVTHETEIARYAQRVLVLRDGLVKSDFPVHERRNAEDDLANWGEGDAIFGEVML